MEVKEAIEKNLDGLCFPCFCSWKSSYHKGKRFFGQINKGYFSSFYYQLCDLTLIKQTENKGNIIDSDYSLKKLIKNYDIIILS